MSAAAASSIPAVQPSFEQLPVDHAGPPFNAWGLYGPHNELGRRNLITPQAVWRGLAAARDGTTINLKCIPRYSHTGCSCHPFLVAAIRQVEDW